MRTKFTVHTSGAVTVEYDTAVFEERVERTFFKRGAYVYETTKNGNGAQVCDRLQSTGETLRAPSDESKLVDVIRAEYKAMRRAEVAQAH
jgi:hypothetical protein